MNQDMQILRGDGTWPWSAHIDGDDIVINDAIATCFGGSADPQDDGQTASGINTKDNPGLAACALPRCYVGRNRSLVKALGGSPIPAALPFGTKVQISSGQISFTVPFIDIGPAKYTKHPIDLTIAAARKINPKATATNFTAIVQVRIIGGAKYAAATYSH